MGKAYTGTPATRRDAALTVAIALAGLVVIAMIAVAISAITGTA